MSYHWKDGGGGGGDEKGISSVLLRWPRNLCNHSTAQTLSSFTSLHKSSWLASRSITPTILSKQAVFVHRADWLRAKIFHWTFCMANYRAEKLLNGIKQNPAISLIVPRETSSSHYIWLICNETNIYIYINERHIKKHIEISHLLMQV